MRHFLLLILLTFIFFTSKAQRSDTKQRLTNDSTSWYRYYFPRAVDSILAKNIRYNSRLYLDTANDYKQDYYLVLKKVDKSTWMLQSRYNSDVRYSSSEDKSFFRTVFRYTVIAGLKIPLVSEDDYQFGLFQVRTDHDLTITFTKQKIVKVSPYSGF